MLEFELKTKAIGCWLSAVSFIKLWGRDFSRPFLISWNLLFLAERVRDWSGILCERERDLGTGNGEWDWGTDFLSDEKTKSEQRYSGKPDGDSRNAIKGLRTKG